MTLSTRSPILLTIGLSLVIASVQGAHSHNPPEPSDSEDSAVSPVLQIQRGKRPPPRKRGGDPTALIRSIDGSNNNLKNPEMGATHTGLRRALLTDYGDGISTMAGQHRPGPREISNAVCAQSASIPNLLDASDYLWQWGQFLDHDIDLTDGTDPPELENIAVPAGDPWFDPDGTGQKFILFNRSIYDPQSGIDSPREQLNEITAWIDASNVYGSDEQRQVALRTLDGTGRLKTNNGLLPWNEEGLPNAGGPGANLFLAGDVRANEQVALTALHTLFVREHNRLAAEIADKDSRLDGDEIYERARMIVGAQMQVITYREYLPALLGRDALRPYRGYDPKGDAGISNVFSTASYRYGHSALSSTLLRLDANGEEIAEGHLALRDAFFSPSRITDEGGIEPILRGLAAQRCQAVDVFVIDDVRNFLFGEPRFGGFDLAALNIQRGRDHGLPSYNDACLALGLAPARSFSDISSNAAVHERLASIYSSVDDIDLWIGGLAEDPQAGSHVGPLIAKVLIQQFEALRDCDRFWYELVLDRDERRSVERTRLSDIIRRNTGIGHEIPDNVFLAPESDRRRDHLADADPKSEPGGASVLTPVLAAPTSHALHQNVPNPFNPTTTIHYDVATGGGNVSLKIFDVRGRLVRTLVDGNEGAGRQSAIWDGRDNAGNAVATGAYFYRLTAPGYQETRKMVLLK